MLRHFYADVRQDPLIGPIFNAQIKDWKHHLEVIASFWETIIGGPSTYARPMPNETSDTPTAGRRFRALAFPLAG
jgi:hemoglobin